MSGVMAGPQASPLFRDAATQMDIRWRYTAAGGDPRPLSPEDQQRVITQSMAGATLGARATLRAIFSRSPEADAARKIVRTALNPGLMASGGHSDGWDWELDSPLTPGEAPPIDQLDEAELHPTSSAARLRPLAPPPPTFRLGTHIRLLPSAPIASGSAEPIRFSPNLASTLQTTSLGPDLLRVDLLVHPVLGPRPPRAPAATAVWAAAARQRLHPSLSLLGDVGGDAHSALPQRLRYGVELRPPAFGPFVLALTQARPFEGPRPGDTFTALVLRSTLRWTLPSQPDAWPLGQVPLADGPLTLDPGPTGPNRLEPLAGRPTAPTWTAQR